MIAKLARSGVALGLLTSVLVSLWILFWLPGWSYYRTPLSVRGYEAAHTFLRPSGPGGQMFGVVGGVMILVPFLYQLRKRLGRRAPGNLRTFLEIHLFCGIVGPVLVTYHTSFKFNGIISAAYWSMVTVVLSGFVGRYLYARIPRSIRGTELTRADLDQEAEALRHELVASAAGGGAAGAVAACERVIAESRIDRPTWPGLMFGEVAVRRRVGLLARALQGSGLSADERTALLTLTRTRALLLQRSAYLQKTKAAFDLWHVFHLPLVYVLLVIVAAHVALAIYLGYVPFRW